MPLRKDIWRVGIVRAPLPRLVAKGSLEGEDIQWLPETHALSFMADPFAIRRDGKLYVFVETYDYFGRVGRIEVLTFDSTLALLDRRLALAEPWHLSYPFVVESEGETYMLPEAFRSGRLTLYRAEEFPHRWVPAATLQLDQVPIDATPFYHEGLWWLFYTSATSKQAKVSALHVAFAPHLMGPWTPHPRNPVRFNSASARPGGTPFADGGAVVLPVQDCRHTYGGAMRALRIPKLTPTDFEAVAGEAIHAPASAGRYMKGLHTLSAVGELTLIDVKRFQLSAGSLMSDVNHAVRKVFQRRWR